MKKKASIAVALFFLVIGSVTVYLYAWLYWSPRGTLVRGPDFEAAVADPTSGRWRGKWADTGKPVDYWRVQEEQVLGIEDALTRFMHDNRPLFASDNPVILSDYWRQYIGYERDGIRWVRIYFYRKGFVTRRQWLDFVQVDDGPAYCNWSIRYSPDKQTFGNLYPWPLSGSNAHEERDQSQQPARMDGEDAAAQP